MSALKDQLLRTEILCQCPDLVNETASDYIAGLMRDWYSIDDDGQFVQTNSTPLRATDLKRTPMDQIGNYLREKHKYLFREPATPGSSSTQIVAQPAPALSCDRMTQDQKAEVIRQYGQQAYLDLPVTAAESLLLAEKRRSEMSLEEKIQVIRQSGSDYYLSLPA